MTTGLTKSMDESYKHFVILLQAIQSITAVQFQILKLSTTGTTLNLPNKTT